MSENERASMTTKQITAWIDELDAAAKRHTAAAEMYTAYAEQDTALAQQYTARADYLRRALEAGEAILDVVKERSEQEEKGWTPEWPRALNVPVASMCSLAPAPTEDDRERALGRRLQVAEEVINHARWAASSLLPHDQVVQILNRPLPLAAALRDHRGEGTTPSPSGSTEFEAMVEVQARAAHEHVRSLRPKNYGPFDSWEELEEGYREYLRGIHRAALRAALPEGSDQ